MAKKTITELKNYFKAGKRPTEDQFGDLLDSYLHLSDPAAFPGNFKYKDLSVKFPNLESNLAVDILLGNIIQGNIEIQVVGAWNNENTVGVVKKQIIIGANANGGIWYQPLSRIVEASGPITDHIYLGDIVWDSSIGQYKLTLYHTRQSGNTYAIRLIQHCNSTAVVDKAVLSDIYTNVLTGQNKHYVNYNDNVGIGTKKPLAPLDIQGRILLNAGSTVVNGVGIVGYTTQWARGYNFVSPDSTQYLGGFGALGTNNQIDHYFVGKNGGSIAKFFVADDRIFLKGNVGVGTEAPSAKLDVVGEILSGNKSATEGVNALAIRYESGSFNNWGSLRSGAETYMSYGVKASSATAYGWVSSNASFSNYKTAITVGNEGVKFLGSTNAQTSINSAVTMNEFMRITPNGNVGIGTKNPDQKLTVKGKIHAEDVVVDMNVPADYVFQKYFDGQSSLRPDYQMPTLQELESFVKENKHLPEIPSEEAIIKDGVNLGDFQMKLLQKIEELTLYVISQNKEIENLKAIIEK
ncbi:hypothetical protein [Chryseobacterium bernardetii]|uniref:hypothetical protein n=1 Tax=Chryseobacterium bernardetii TaxID=1241978 RepID=UPI003AF4181A